MDNDEKSIKKALIRSSDVIRRKYRILKSDRYDVNSVLEKNLSPITIPLKKLVDNQETLNTKIKSEFKNIKEESNVNDGGIKFENGINKRKFEEKIDEDPIFEQEDESNLDDESEIFQSFSDDNNIKVDEDDIMTQQSSSTPFKSPLYKTFVAKLKHSSREIDTVYGPRYENKLIKLGNYSMSVKDGIISINNNKFNATRGLYELIFLKEPIDYDKNDLVQYEKILKLTSAHRRNYNSRTQINGNKSSKYVNIIGKLFNAKTKSTGMGMRIPKMMKLENIASTTNLVYWDNCNELVERLQLLMGSKMAGNTAHNNEIISIINELRESKIIE